MPRTIFYKGSVPRSAWTIGPTSWAGNETYYATPSFPPNNACPGTILVSGDTGVGTVKRLALNFVDEIIIQVVGPFEYGVLVVVPADPGGYPIVAISAFGGLGSHAGESDFGCPP